MFRRLAKDVRRQWIGIGIGCVALFAALGGPTLAPKLGSAGPKAGGTVAIADFSALARQTGEQPRRRRSAYGYNRWSWFKNTYWIVPQQGIYSVYHNPKDPNRFNVLRGQTVFHITDYFNGYWSGAVVVKLTRSLVPSCQYVLGEVTPEGNVYMTMYNAGNGDVTNTPIGSMVRKNGKWTMVNQMTGPASGGTLSHWAYMVQSTSKDKTYNRLPFARQSIPDFMSSCPDGPKISRP